jgi:hypothetical protein
MRNHFLGIAMAAAVAGWSTAASANVTFDFSNGECFGATPCVDAGAGNDFTQNNILMSSGGVEALVSGFSPVHGDNSAVYYQRSKGPGKSGLGVAYLGYEDDPTVGGNEAVNINFGDRFFFELVSQRLSLMSVMVLDNNELPFDGEIAINGITLSVIDGIVQDLQQLNQRVVFEFSNVAAPSGVADDSAYFVSKITVTPVPAALPLMLSGIAGIAWLRRRRQRQLA